MTDESQRRWDDCTGDPCICPKPVVVMTPGSLRGVPNTPGTPRRTIRVPDALWEAAQAKAQGRGEDLSSVIRKALERYVKRR